MPWKGQKKMESLYNGFKISLHNFLESKLPGVTFVYAADTPDLSIPKWISVIYGDYDPVGTIKKAAVIFHCFTREDPEGLFSASLIDQFLNIFIDKTSVDGLIRIPLQVVKDGATEQKATIVTSDITVDESYRVGTDIVGQAVTVFFIWV